MMVYINMERERKKTERKEEGRKSKKEKSL
jgi:hypothetical protein